MAKRKLSDIYLFTFLLANVGAVLSLEPPSQAYFLAKKSLITKLTNNSSVMKEILPVLNASSPVVLKLGISLHQISDVNEINQAIRLTTWLRLYWNNPFLQWDPDDYQGIESVHLDSDRLWTPDLSLFNQASLEEEIDILYKRMSTKLILKSTGDISWFAPISLLTQCKIDVSHFPFDEQECRIVFGSWTYSDTEINITYKSTQVDLKKFIENGEWEVTKAILERNVVVYETAGSRFPDVTFRLGIKRRPLYYIINLLVPCSLIALLSFISFVLPSNHGERVSLVITVLLANSVYMLIVSSSLPQTSDVVPVVGIYFVSIIIEIALCLFATCLTSKLYEKTSEMPAWLNTLTNNWLARCVFIKDAKKYVEHEAENEMHEMISNEKFTRISDRTTFGNHTGNGMDKIQQDLEVVEANFSPNNETTQSEPNKSYANLFAELHVLADEVRARHSKDKESKKWRRAARILDRIFLIMFVVIYIILTIYLLASM